MSKASEWAKTPAAELGTLLRPNHPHQQLLALAERNGDLYMELRHVPTAVIGASISPDQALALAHWILDVFGEKED